MDMNVVILYANECKIVDEKTGEVTKGTSIFYYGKDNFKPKFKVNETSGLKASGTKPVKAWLTETLALKISAVPGVYEMEVEISSDKDMKAQMKIEDIQFLGTLESSLVVPVKK